jgi:hypothetical protein
MRKHAPTSRLGWFNYYANRFEKTLAEQTAHMACWYWLLHLEHEHHEQTP